MKSYPFGITDYNSVSQKAIFILFFQRQKERKKEVLRERISDNEIPNKVLKFWKTEIIVKLVDFLIKKKKFVKMLFQNKKFASSLYKKYGSEYYDYLEQGDIKSKISRKPK